MINSFLAILIANVLQLILFSVVLFYNKKYGIKANKVLSLLLFIMAFAALLAALNQLMEIWVLSSSEYVLSMLVAPIFYFYIRTYLTNNYVFKIKHLWHSIPFIVQLFIWIFYVLPIGQEQKIWGFDQIGNFPDLFLIQLQ